MLRFHTQLWLLSAASINTQRQQVMVQRTESLTLKQDMCVEFPDPASGPGPAPPQVFEQLNYQVGAVSIAPSLSLLDKLRKKKVK